MDAAQQTRQSRKQELLLELAELMIEEQVEQGVFLNTPHYSVIELAAMNLGREFITLCWNGSVASVIAELTAFCEQRGLDLEQLEVLCERSALTTKDEQVATTSPQPPPGTIALVSCRGTTLPR